MIFSAFLMPVTRGLLLGKKFFLPLGMSLVVEGLSKLFLSLILIFVGFKVAGAIFGIILSNVIAFFYTFIKLKKIRAKKEKIAKTLVIYKYSKPVFVTNLIIILFLSLDIIIAKVLFSPETTGIYAIASVISKSIFMISHPLGKALFPLSASNIKVKKSSNLFLNSLLMFFLIIIPILCVILIFPEIVVRIFTGRIIKEIIPVIFILGLSVSLLSLSNLIISYKLSQNKTKNYLGFVLIIPIQLFLTIYFSSDILSFCYALLCASAIFLITSVALLNK